MNYDKIFINGEWLTPSSTDRIDVENPANKKIIGSVPACKEKDVDLAVIAAKKAFSTWQFTSLEKRIKLVKELVKELRNKEDELVDIIVKELGAPTEFARNTHLLSYLDEIDYLINLMKKYPLKEEHDGFTIYKEPVGVVGAITPWNYPLGQITKKLIPASYRIDYHFKT